MKNLIYLILIIAAGSGAAQGKTSSRLFVPSFSTVIQPFEDDIFLPAYNIDLVRAWPADLHPMEYIIAGNDACKLTLKVKGKFVILSVQQALNKKYITLFSITKAVNGRNEGLIMEARPNVKLVSLVNKGLIACDTSEIRNNLSLTVLNRDISHDYSLNCMFANTWSDNQQKIWKVMCEPVISLPETLDSLQREIYTNIIAGSHNLPPYYKTGYQKGTIIIHAAKDGFNTEKPEPNYYNDGGMPFLMLGSITSQLKVLISEDPEPASQGNIYFGDSGSGLDSIVVRGKYRGIIPLKIRFTTDQKVELMASFDENQNVLGTNEPYPVKLFLAYDTAVSSKECRISLPKTMDFPVGKNTSTLKACGIVIQPEENGLTIGL